MKIKTDYFAGNQNQQCNTIRKQQKNTSLRAQQSSRPHSLASCYGFTKSYKKSTQTAMLFSRYFKLKIWAIWLVHIYRTWACLGVQWTSILYSLTSSYGFITSYKKSTQMVKSFLRYSNKKNQAIWLVHTNHARVSLGEPQSSRTHSLTSSYGCIIAYKKLAQTVQPFLRYSNLKNRAIWLVNTILGHKTRTGFLPNMRFSQNNA